MAATDGPRGWIAGWERFFDCFVDFRRRSWLGLGSAFVRVVEARQDLALVDAEETFLIRSDLVHVDVVVTRVDEFLDSLHVRLRIGAAEDGARYVVLAYELEACSKSWGVAISVNRRPGTAAFGQCSKAILRAVASSRAQHTVTWP